MTVSLELEYIILIILGFLSEILGTMAGFGSSTIFLPLASYLVEFKTALVLVAIFHLFGNVSRITFFRHGLDWNVLLIFGIPSFVLSLIGATLVGNFSQTFLKLMLGIFLIVLSVLFLLKPKSCFSGQQQISSFRWRNFRLYSGLDRNWRRIKGIISYRIEDGKRKIHRYLSCCSSWY